MVILTDSALSMLIPFALGLVSDRFQLKSLSDQYRESFRENALRELEALAQDRGESGEDEANTDAPLLAREQLMERAAHILATLFTDVHTAYLILAPHRSTQASTVHVLKAEGEETEDWDKLAHSLHLVDHVPASSQSVIHNRCVADSSMLYKGMGHFEDWHALSKSKKFERAVRVAREISLPVPSCTHDTHAQRADPHPSISTHTPQITLPVHGGSHIIGSLHVFFRTKNPQVEHDLLGLLADRLGSALVEAEAHEQNTVKTDLLSDVFPTWIVEKLEQKAAAARHHVHHRARQNTHDFSSEFNRVVASAAESFTSVTSPNSTATGVEGGTLSNMHISSIPKKATVSQVQAGF